MERKTTVIIVGAGPAGLATSACLNLQNIPNIVLEREDCYASLWRKRASDRLKLHLAKHFCELPHLPFPPNAPTFIPKHGFIQYLDDYVSHFNITPFCNSNVVSASFDDGNWVVVAENTQSGTIVKWVAAFLVVATGENSKAYVPPVPGLSSFFGEAIHSNVYANGDKLKGKDVLVVGAGNSGMEIALDLSNWGAKTSMVIRSPVHVLNEELVRLGMVLLQYLPVLMLSRWKYGDLSDCGLQRPREGPFYLKGATGRSAVIDVGTLAKIRAREIQVLPSISEVNEGLVHFTNGIKKSFEAIVFATGYRSTVRRWLKVF